MVAGPDEPQFVRMRVPAVDAVRDLQRSNQALISQPDLQLSPAARLSQQPKGVGLSLQQVGQLVKRLVRKGECHHRRAQIIVFGPGHGLLDLDTPTLLDRCRADRAGPNASAGHEAAVVGRLVLCR